MWNSRCVLTIRNAEPSDYDRVSPIVDDWWGGLLESQVEAFAREVMPDFT